MFLWSFQQFSCVSVCFCCPHPSTLKKVRRDILLAWDSPLLFIFLFSFLSFFYFFFCQGGKAAVKKKRRKTKQANVTCQTTNYCLFISCHPRVFSETLSPGQVLFTVLCNQAPCSSARGCFGWTPVLLLLFLFVAPKVEKGVGVHPSALSWAV